MIKKAFTLIEMVIVIVLLGIVSTLGIGLLKVVFEGYINSKNLFQLFYEAKFGAERIDRELREAIPNSVVIEIDNSTITFVKFSKGGYYLPLGPNKISTDISLNLGDNLSIYNKSFSRIYNNNSCNPLDNTSSIYRIDNKTDNYTLCKSLSEDSPVFKFYLIDEAITFRSSNNKIERCSSKDFTQHPVVSNCLTLINNVKSAKFNYSQSKYNINDQIVDIYLEMSKNDVNLNYKHKVHIRNTP